METTLAVGVGRRRIIKRPRLTRMLDESGARIILLVAPAGYGKTTLAHEWLEDKRAAWYRGSPASADVAALAVGLAEATAEIMSGAGDRMRQRLRATDRPEEDARIFAEMLAEDLAKWPDDTWLAIDDYHFAMDDSAGEAFVGALIECAPARFLITTRRRPTWATARRRLYGQVFELDRTLLAMNDKEALDVLAQRSDAPTLVARAAGWPAVIGLAALTVESTAPSNDVPAALYDYFAEELLQAAAPDARLALCRLAVAPSITNESAAHLLGPQARDLLVESVSSGILPPQAEGHFELHPLLRAFLQDRLREFGTDMVDATVERAGIFLLLHERWDDAISLAQKFRDAHFLDQLINAAWESMLDEGRLATLSRLVDLASELRLRSSLLDLVEAEISFRQGSYQKAEALALEAARSLTDDHLLVRAYTRAGQSAHFEGRDEDALLHHRRAQSLARLKGDRREALWGEFVCAIQLESSDCVDALNRLAALGSEDPTDFVRLANGRMVFAMRNGRGIKPELLSAIHRLPKVDDPLIRSSFLHVWSCVLTFMGKYDEALEATEQQLREADQYRLAFVLPHAHLRRAVAFRGLRRFRDAVGSLQEARRHRDKSDDYVAVFSDSTRIGLYLAIDDVEAALRMNEPTATSASTDAVAELIAVRALALACADRHDEAKDAATRAARLSSAAEPRLLCKLAAAISALARKAPRSSALVAEAFHDVIGSDGIDAFVTAYRGFPRLLSEVAKNDQYHAKLASILEGARDERLARALLPTPLSRQLFGDPLLSPRERDVLALVSQGLRNREIAEKLFISEVTVKAHVRNILRKLGAKSRAHAVSLASRMD